MNRFLSFAIAATVGAAIAYLLDPDRGRTRRAKLADQATARIRDASETVKARAKYQKGVFKGVVHDVSEPLREEEAPDADTLLQKVRSEALGYGPDEASIEVDVVDGTVRVSGSVDKEADRKRLIKLITAVDGVDMIDDRLHVKA